MARLTANHPLQAHPLMPPSSSTSAETSNGEVILPFSKRPVVANNNTTTSATSKVDESIKSSSSSAASTKSSQSNSTNTNNSKMKKREQLIQQLPRSIRWRLNLGLLTMPTGEITLPTKLSNTLPSSSTATAAATAVVNEKKSMSSSNGTLPVKDFIFDNPSQLQKVASVTNINSTTTNNIKSPNGNNDNDEESKETSAAVASLLQYIEDSNALKLRCQRSRYEDLEKRHYYSNTIMGIADGSGSSATTTSQHQSGVDSTTTTSGTTSEQSLQQSHPSEAASPISSLVGNKLHQVAPGDDPLSALLAAPSTNNNNNNNNNNNGMFGFGKGNRQKKNASTGNNVPSASSNENQDGDNNNATTSNSQTSSNNKRTNRPNNNNLRSSDTSQTSTGTTENNEETACKGSRWADYYSTREVLDVIEKDLNRLPNDHYTIYHEWKMYQDDDLARKRVLENGGGGGTISCTVATIVASGNSSSVIPETTSVPSISTHAKKGDRRSGLGRQKNRFGNSFKLKDSFNFGTNNNNNNLHNSNNSGNSNNGMPGGDNKNAFWSNLISKDEEEDGAVTSTDVSRKERADRLSQLLFVYAREHPEIGYRQGMHETLSFVLLALEMDLLEQSVQKEKNIWKRDIMELRRSCDRGGMAGVDGSGQIVTVRLLDRNYILHDAFALFECVMSALAPAYDAIPAGEEETAAILEKAKLERGESPMEAMVSKIMSKIRFVARDEALFGMVLCMPVPPQIYFAKWVRLMFGREISGGMKNVMKLWDAFFDLASKIEHREEEITLSLALMNVLETAAASMIILIRDKLLKPSMARDGTMIGEPDPNEGIAYLMNYPSIEDIDHLIKVISSLLLKERSLSQLHERRLSEEEDDQIIEDPFVTGTGRLQDLNRPRQVAPISPEKDITVAQPQMYAPQPKVDVAESLGNFAAGLFDIGTRTVDAAISTYQKHQAEKQQQIQNGMIDHPLQFGFNAPPPPPIRQDRVEESMGRNDETYTVEYRNHVETEPLEGQDILVYKASLNDSQKSLISDNGTPNNDSEVVEFQHPESDIAFNRSKNSLDAEEASTASIYIDNFENGDDTTRPRSSSSRNRPRSNSRSSRSMSRNLTTRKSPKSLALKLDKSVKTLMTHFELQQRHLADDVPASTVNGGTKIIPEEIWEAMAAIDAVKKELLTQDALETLER